MRRFAFVAVLFGVLALSTSAFAQGSLVTSFASIPSATVAIAPAPRAAQGRAVVRASNGWPRFGVGATVGSLGIGFQAGISLLPRINVRGGAGFFTYSPTFNKDGIDYNAEFQLRSVDAKLDLFLLGGFRVTPGLLLYNDNSLSATAKVSGGQSFTLGGVTYFSYAPNPVTGSAALTLNKVAPTLGIGFGNLLPRSSRHFSVTLDLGVVFQGSPEFVLGLSGVACTPTASANCTAVTNPTIQANITKEQNKVSDDLRAFKYYPEATLGLGWKF